MDAIDGATKRIRYYRVARRLYGILMESGDRNMDEIQPLDGLLPPNAEQQTVNPEEVGMIDQGLTIIPPAPAAKPAPQPLERVQIRGMSTMGSSIRTRLESVRANMTGLRDDLASLDETLTDMRGHVNATHKDIHSDATMLGNSSGNGGQSSQELADKLTGDA